ERMAATQVTAVQRRRPAALLLAAAAGVAAVCWGSSLAPSFVLGQPTLQRSSAVARRAEEAAAAVLEAPPSDEQLEGTVSKEPRPSRRIKPKRERRGTLCYARRELNEEAERMRAVIQPLLMERHLSIKEVTFVLNRIGAPLRHLMYKPRQGVPIFTEHKVRRLCRRAKNEKGDRLIRFVRPPYLPPLSPGAPYPPPMKDVYAEVPPLGWQGGQFTPMKAIDERSERDDGEE
ncbi:unnamed protein product, partial [Polarella glacialis]